MVIRGLLAPCSVEYRKVTIRNIILMECLSLTDTIVLDSVMGYSVSMMNSGE